MEFFPIKMKNYNVIGLMSGTSVDGLDLVYVRFKYENSWSYRIIYSKTYSYNDKWKTILKKLSKTSYEMIKEIDRNYTKLLSKIILEFISEFSISNIDFVSSHGHTALHDPSNSLTYQIGNLPEISSLISLKVICDFRSQDIKLGGQGAPLVPVGEKYLFSEFNTFINLGGFANITKKLNNKLIAYDICPINIIFNYLSSLNGCEYDDRGKIASTGKMNNKLYDSLQSINYYKLKSPKSLSAEWINTTINPLLNKFSEIPVQDLLNTFSNHFAFQIVSNIQTKDKILITGGGVYNSYLIDRINNLTNAKITIPDRNIIEYKEALIFAFLGLLRYLNIDNCYSSVTGSEKDHCSGNIFNP
tara:strand:- start:3090 stop:4166 length:1077 start_codon:yes stop_codon:yes gene_type:complete